MASFSIDKPQPQPQRRQGGNMKSAEPQKLQAEKQTSRDAPEPEGRRSISFVVGVACVAFLIVLQQVSSSASAQELDFTFRAAAAPQLDGDAEVAVEFDWLTITPNADLEYHDCYDGAYQCARLEVPMNYLDESDTRKVAIAMMKLPATVPDDDPAFGGPIFFNPGGPGIDGTGTMLNVGSLLQGYFDIPDERHYEIIAFDSRGLGWSTPVANCFADTNELARQVTNWEFRGLGARRADRYSTAYYRAIYSGENTRCNAVADGEPNGSIFSFMSTASVVRDMVSMIDKIQESRGGPSPNSTVSRRADEVARLNYIGFSYGTALGNYFASMYPGRVGHMILDSVVDVEDYIAAPGWLTTVEDMDATFVQFLKGCFDAIPELCPIRKPEDTSWEDLETRFWDFIRKLNDEPVSTLSADGYTITITGSDFISFFGSAAYSPITTFTSYAYIIGAAMDGDFDAMVRVLVASGYTPVMDAYCPGNVTTTLGSDSMKGIACGDAEDETDRDLDYWDDYVQKQNQTSAVWGAEIANIRLPCGSWRLRPEYRFTGPFTTPEASSIPTEGVPLAPLLFLNNEYDPVTPQASARRMVKTHPGAQLIIQNSLGHGVVSNAPSNCTREYVQAFMKDGSMPDEEKYCEVSCDPWDPEGCVNPWAPTGAAVGRRSTVTRGAKLDLLHDIRQRMKDFPLGIYF